MYNTDMDFLSIYNIYLQIPSHGQHTCCNTQLYLCVLWICATCAPRIVFDLHAYSCPLLPRMNQCEMQERKEKSQKYSFFVTEFQRCVNSKLIKLKTKLRYAKKTAGTDNYQKTVDPIVMYYTTTTTTAAQKPKSNDNECKNITGLFK